MANHDYVIANQNGANTRSDLNSAFSAIVSNNSSASEPSTTYAYMWWADTTNDLLKQRNAANGAWIDILVLSTGAPATSGATEGSAVLSTGETGGVKFLREDGDGTSSWQSIVSDPAMGGDLSGTASNAQIVANAVGTAEIANSAVTDAKISGMSSSKLSGALPAIDGSALTNLPASGFGVGQSWSTVTASRALGTTYTNSTGKPMLVSASISHSNQCGLWGYINGVYVSFSTGAQVSYGASVLLVVPDGNTYKMANAGGSLSKWYEYS